MLTVGMYCEAYMRGTTGISDIHASPMPWDTATSIRCAQRSAVILLSVEAIAEANFCSIGGVAIKRSSQS